MQQEIKIFHFSKDHEYHHCVLFYPFRIFYTMQGDSRSPKNLHASRHEAIPDYILQTLSLFVKAYTLFTQQYTFASPLKEGIFYKQGAKFIDILLTNIPKQKGLVAGEAVDNGFYFKNIQTMQGKSIRIFLDNDLIHKTATPIHELFHVFQYNYCSFNNMWFMEGLARWSQNLTHVREHKYESLPASLKELNALFQRKHDAEYFWRRLFSFCDDAAAFVKTFLVESQLQARSMEQTFGNSLGYRNNDWSNEAKKSSLNNEYILKALLNTLRLSNIKQTSELQNFLHILQAYTAIKRVHTCHIDEHTLHLLEGVQEIAGDLIIDASGLTVFHGSNKLKKIRTLCIKNNTNLLEITGFDALESIENIEISHNPNLIKIDAFQNFFQNISAIQGFIKIVSNKKLNDIDFLKGLRYVGSSLYLHHNHLIHIAGLENLSYVGASFSLASNFLESIRPLYNLKEINGTLSLAHNNLDTLDGLENLSRIKTGKWNGKNRTLAIFGNKNLSDIAALRHLQTDESYIILEIDTFKQYLQLPSQDSVFHTNILEIHDKDAKKIIPTYLFREKTSHDYKNFRAATHNKNLEYLIDFELDCDTLVISFSGFNGYLGGMFHNRFSYITDTIHTNKIFINDTKNLWYHHGIAHLTQTIDETIEFIRSFTQIKEYKKILCFGASMGGYMALLTGKLINATDIFAVSPQTFLDTQTRTFHGDTRWSKEIHKINQSKDAKYLNLKELYSSLPKCNIQIHYAKRLSLDAIHANYLNLAGHSLFAYDLDDHYLAVYLHKKALLEKLILGMLHPDISASSQSGPIKILFGRNWKKATCDMDFIEAYHTDFEDITNAMRLILEHKIKILFANNYKTQLTINMNQELLRSLGCRFLVNELHTLQQLVDKQLFYDIMVQNNLEAYVPKYYKDPKEITYPCIVKTKTGGAGKGIFLAYSEQDLRDVRSDRIISEYLPSTTEYATSIFAKNGTILKHITYCKTSQNECYILQHEANDAIEVQRCETPFLELFAKIISIFGGHNGYIQCSINFKIENNMPKIFEINPRIGYTLAGFPQDFKEMLACYLDALEKENA